MVTAQPLSLRPCTAADAFTVHRFISDLENTELDWPAFLATYEQNLANPSVQYWLAERVSDAVGFLSVHIQWLLHHAGPIAEIQELYVRPDCRNQRIGEQLIGKAEEIARTAGCLNLEVTTNRRRLDTHRFYERLLAPPSHFKFVKPL